MKYQNFFFLSLFIALLGITSCVDDDGFFQDCEKGRGPIVEEVLDLSDFKGIEAAKGGSKVLEFHGFTVLSESIITMKLSNFETMKL